MSQVNSVMKLHWVSSGSKVAWLVLPWGIVCASLLINILLGAITGAAIQTGGLAAIYIFMGLAGNSILNATFHFSLGFSVPRKDYFAGTAAMFGIFNILNSLALYILTVVEDLTNGWGVRLTFFKVAYLTDGSAIEQLVVFFLILLCVSFFGFLTGAVYQRFGMFGIYNFLGLLGLILTVVTFFTTFYSWWDEIFDWLGQYSAFALSLWTLPVTAAFGLATYLLLRKATV
jgi:hypothetical protein